MTDLYLGNVAFESFEVPERIVFGGLQRLAVHKLIGGTRVIDCLGRDDSALTWSGVLSGQSAAGRARDLDAMRVAGGPLNLSWDAFCYSVLIGKLQFQFCNPWWIPYEISCVVQADLAQSAAVIAASDVQALAGDLATAAGLLGLGYAPAIGSVSALAAAGGAAQGQALAILTSTQHAVTAALQADDVVIDSPDLMGVVAAAGLSAKLSCARGYLGRSIANLESERV